MLRSFLLGATALLLVGCGGGEEYPVPAGQAASMLAGLSYSPAIAPMPVALQDVSVSFESLPGGNAVQWSFTKNGDDLGRIVATVEKSGEAASEVTVDYVEGNASDKGDFGQIRDQLRGGVQQLLIEAVDSTLDGRQFNMALRDQVDSNITIAMMGSMMVSASDAMDKAAKKGSTGSRRTYGPKPVSSDPSGKAAPTTDLSRFSN